MGIRHTSRRAEVWVYEEAETIILFYCKRNINKIRVDVVDVPTVVALDKTPNARLNFKWTALRSCA